VVDVFSKEKRSWVMSRIRGVNTQPELQVRRLLHAHGYRFRLHRNDLPGNPDIVLPKYRTAIFVHGCFWHGHSCREGRRPKSNSTYWNAKLDRNVARDKRRAAEYRKIGWRRVVVWTCELDAPEKLERRLLRLLHAEQ
jgi:DNA mismatch endonuclease (patch repair protein)